MSVHAARSQFHSNCSVVKPTCLLPPPSSLLHPPILEVPSSAALALSSSSPVLPPPPSRSSRFRSTCSVVKLPAPLQAAPKILDVAGAAGSSGQPLLVTGPAACGKSTIAKQYAHRLATDCLEGRGQLVPLVVMAIELAATISERKLCAADDLLGEHIRRTESDKALVDFLLAKHAQHKLVVILDGVGEAGDVHPVLQRLAGEVVFCVTGRENGIENVVISTGLAHLAKHCVNVGLSGDGSAEVGHSAPAARPSPFVLRPSSFALSPSPFARRPSPRAPPGGIHPSQLTRACT